MARQARRHGKASKTPRQGKQATAARQANHRGKASKPPRQGEQATAARQASHRGKASKPPRQGKQATAMMKTNLFDESVVEQWNENTYFLYFCGMREFYPSSPCAWTELMHFHNRIGKEGRELIFQESIRMNNKIMMAGINPWRDADS